MRKEISVKLYGNPCANSGFEPIIIKNNPNFEIADPKYAGFVDCSYFFTLKIMKEQTIFQLVKNNVRSYNASRPGSLVFAFSIPKGFILHGGATPYDVLIKLKDTFLERCMNCRDETRGTYEFNKESIDENILDDVISQFTLEPSDGPYRRMQEEGPSACVVLDDKTTELFFKDVQYPEFKEYKEILIGESWNGNGGYKELKLEVPRRPTYQIIVDGKPDETTQDRERPFTYQGKKEKKYFRNGTVCFTISRLLNGEKIPNVTLDKIKECVHVSTNNLYEPKDCILKVTFPDYENEMRERRREWTLYHNNIPQRLDSNLTLTLKGEDISWLENPSNFKIITNCGSFPYEMTNGGLTKVNDTLWEIAVNIIKEKPKINTTQTSITNKGQQTSSKSNHTQGNADCIMLSVTFEEKDEQPKKILIKKLSNEKEGKGKEETTIMTLDAKYAPKAKDEQGTLFIPLYTSWNSYTISVEIRCKKHTYCSESITLPTGKPDNNVKIFKRKEKRASIPRTIKRIAFICWSIALFILGAYVSHIIPIPPNNQSRDSSNDVLLQDSTATDTTAVDTTEESRTMEEITCFDSIIRKKEDLDFIYVNDIYQKSLKQNVPDSTKQRINDYHDAVTAIQDGDGSRINELLNKGNLHLYGIHKKLLQRIQTGTYDNNSLRQYTTEEKTEALKQFQEQYSNYKNFKDLENIKVNTRHDNSNGQTTNAKGHNTQKSKQQKKTLTPQESR